MSRRGTDVWMQAVAGGLHEPTDKHVRVELGGEVVADTARALLVWEPRRIVPSYAVPDDDLRAELVPAPGGPDDGAAAAPVLHPGIPFAVHSSPGEALTVRTAGGAEAAGAGFRPAAAELDGYVVLDYFAFDAWYEEDERIVGHPRDPFKRIDLRRSSRPIRVELDGVVLAESARPLLLFETWLPTRSYLPAADVRTDLLRPSATRSRCAYKGEASYWSYDGPAGVVEDICWSYRHPLPDVAPITDLIAFFDERADVIVDGDARSRPRTVWSDGVTPEPSRD